MRKNFIKELTEAAISTTDLALNVEGMSEAIQSMIEKITNIKTKDLAVLVKKIKYDNDIAKADEFNQNIGGKLDQLIQSMTEIKGEIDNVTVSMLNGEDDMSTSETDDEIGDFEADFGDEGEESEEGDMSLDLGNSEEGEEGESLEDLTGNLDSLTREEK